jgi:eukaryotic-like serine/threonine-protein kinase
MAESALVDLVCGPASPLPETYQRYRLVAKLGAGGQADVYRGVRLCGGVTSAALTVKVFRINPRRPLVDELRSWDKGDAALMDLNTRGVTGICRRVDGFYGPPPYLSGGIAVRGEAVPYQVYDYLHGVNLREYVTSRAGHGGGRLNAGATLLALASTLRAMHHPEDATAIPVLHMDIKPSNVMVLTNGDIRLIDFTGARYWRHSEITQISYTPESGGPEALRGEVGPSYDVHGFGAVAFYLVAGIPPRGSDAPPIHKHAIFEGRPALRDHLLAVLADRPDDRPSTLDLVPWTRHLLQLVRASNLPDLGLDWADPAPAANGVPAGARAVGRARPEALRGTETEAFGRIEALERELVALRARVSRSPELAAAPISPVPLAALPPSPPPMPVPHPDGTGGKMMVGRAAVVARQQPSQTRSTFADEPVLKPAGPPALVRRVRRERIRSLKRGGAWTVFGTVFALLSWVIWAAANRSSGVWKAPGVLFVNALVALGVFVVLRLLGRLVIEQWMRKPRRGAHGAHLGTTAFLIAVGVTYLMQTSWIITAYKWIKGMT